MKISKKLREQAADLCQIAASTPDLWGIASVIYHLGYTNKDSPMTLYLLREIVAAAFVEAGTHACSRNRYGTQDWTAQIAVCDACWDVRQAEPWLQTLGKALISLRRMHAERDSLKTQLAKQIDVWDVERKAMEAQLAAMAAARDEACDMLDNAADPSAAPARWAVLRAVGKVST